MEKIEMTASELMSELNWKKSKVYYWINSNKFETIDRETGKNVLITREQIERLRSKNVQENFEIVEESLENSETVQDSSNENVTKHYKTFSNSLEQSDKEYFLESLNTIKVMHQSSLSNFNYSMKLLTDGKHELQEQFFELKANNITMSEKIELKEKELKKLDSKVRFRDFIIIVLMALFVLLSILYFSERSKQLEKVQLLQKIEQMQTQMEKVGTEVEQIKTVQDKMKPNQTTKYIKRK